MVRLIQLEMQIAIPLGKHRKVAKEKGLALFKPRPNNKCFPH